MPQARVRGTVQAGGLLCRSGNLTGNHVRRGGGMAGLGSIGLLLYGGTLLGHGGLRLCRRRRAGLCRRGSVGLFRLGFGFHCCQMRAFSRA